MRLKLSPTLTGPSGGRGWVREWLALGAVWGLVVAVFALMAHPGAIEQWGGGPQDSYYNLLVRGFRNGKLSIDRAAPAGLMRLADPYDPVANISYRWLDGSPVHDLSLYRGKLYLYFGVTPALLLFWPWAAVTGHYLGHRDAALIFCALGFGASVWLVSRLWRRIIPGMSLGLAAFCAFGLGLASWAPVLLARTDVYEVSISCGYAMIAVALALLWRALSGPAGRGWWLAGASLACGLAIGARPSLVFGSVILLAPLVQWGLSPGRAGKELPGLLAAAAGPLLAVGLGLMWYNRLRFGDVFEFGWRYQLAANRQDVASGFGWGWLWFNVRNYLFDASWIGHFPFVGNVAASVLPRGHLGVEDLHGGMGVHAPMVWFALAAPLAWRGLDPESRLPLKVFLGAVGCLFVGTLVTLGCFRAASDRYMMEFLPPLGLLSVAGIFGVERALAGHSGARAARWGWGLALAWSAACGLLAGIDRQGQAENYLGTNLFLKGRVDEAIYHYRKAAAILPRFAAARLNLGVALLRKGDLEGAVRQCRAATEMDPANATAHNNLGYTLARQGKAAEAVLHYRRALEISPEYISALNNLAWTLATCPDAAVRDGVQAAKWGAKAGDLTGNSDPRLLRTLGAVYAENGRFSEAILIAQQAAALAAARGDGDLAGVLRQDAALYRTRTPLREPVAKSRGQ